MPASENRLIAETVVKVTVAVAFAMAVIAVGGWLAPVPFAFVTVLAWGLTWSHFWHEDERENRAAWKKGWWHGLLYDYVSIFPLRLREPRLHATAEFVKRAAREMPKGSKVIDIGAGECQYKPLFRHCKYVAQDSNVFENFEHSQIDVVSDANDIPLRGGSFDFALNTEVMEHAWDTEGMFSEMGRLLRKGGRAYVSVAANGPEHQQPYDYWRFTRYGATRIAEDAGFKVLEIKPAGGYFNFLSFVFMGYGMVPSMRPLAYLLLPLNVAVSAALNALDRLDRKKEFTHHFYMVLEKK